MLHAFLEALRADGESHVYGVQEEQTIDNYVI